METQKKYQIESAFLDAFIQTCHKNKLPFSKGTFLASFNKLGELKFFSCLNNIVKKEIPIEDFFHRKMIAIGMGKESLKKLLQCVHYAFTKETKTPNENISLLIYFSVVAGTVCFGVLENKIAKRTLIVSDLFEAMGLYETSN